MDYRKISKIVSCTLLGTMFLYTAPVYAYTKDETVYSKIDCEGKSYQTIVSTHLKNTDNEDILNDMTNLINIKNLNGNEEFTQNNNSLIWNANKGDIYYQGESNEELPIEVSVKYELDGKEIAAKEIAGKSGKVKVIISYTNKDEHIVKVNGKTEKMYTPFVVVAGTVIKNEQNKNITVTNGKVIDNGNKTIVMGVALPGMQESLKISKSKIDIPSKIEITMESEKFEMGNIMNFVTPKVLEEDDLSMFDDLDKIYSQVNTLSSSSKKIEEGANTLKEGTQGYSEKMGEFESAMKQVSDGMKTANTNYTKINEGIKTLNNNTGTLNDGAKQLADGATQIEANLNLVNENLAKILAGSQELEKGDAQVIAGIDQILTKLNSLPVTDNSSKIQDLQKLVDTNKATISSLEQANTMLNGQLDAGSEEMKPSIETQIKSNTGLIQLLQANVKAEQETIASLKATDSSSINELKVGLNQVKAGLEELNNGTKTLSTGIGALKTGVGTLAEKSGELTKGANTLQKGTKTLSNGVATLKTGSNEMKKGLTTLDNSGSMLVQANEQLTDGAKTINNGANELANGIATFNKEGIQKICNLVNGDIKDISERVKELAKLSKEYNNFAMIEDGVDGNSKFIMIIDAVKEQQEKEDTKNEIIVDDKK